MIAAGYRRDQLKNAANGFGFLVPRSEGLRVLGTVWNSSLFPGRVPEGMASFTSFAGGATDPELRDWSEDKIADTICAEVGRVLGITWTTRDLRRAALPARFTTVQSGPFQHCRRAGSTCFLRAGFVSSRKLPFRAIDWVLCRAGRPNSQGSLHVPELNSPRHERTQSHCSVNPTRTLDPSSVA